MSGATLLRKATDRKYPGFTKGNEGQWKGPFTFIQGADTQFGMIENYIEKKPDPGWEKEIKFTRTAIEAINTMSPRPRFFVVCGDLIDAMPGTRLRLPQEEAFISLFKELHPDIPLICVCGNHDVGDMPTPESITAYQKKFGDDYFSFYCGGVMFIALNSQFYQDPSLVLDLAEKHDEWLNQILKEATSNNCKHVIIFQHIPWFLKKPDEDKIYFNLSKELRQKWLPKFNESNVKAIFCGHWHGNAGGFYKDLEVVVTSAIGAQLRSDKSGFRIVSVTENNIKHKYYSLDEVPKEIDF